MLSIVGRNANVDGWRMTCTLQFSDISANTLISTQHEGGLSIRTRVRSLPIAVSLPSLWVLFGKVKH